MDVRQEIVLSIPGKLSERSSAPCRARASESSSARVLRQADAFEVPAVRLVLGRARVDHVHHGNPGLAALVKQLIEQRPRRCLFRNGKEPGVCGPAEAAQHDALSQIEPMPLM